MTALRIGIDLGGSKIEGVVMDAEGRLLERERVVSPSQSYGAIVQAITALVSRLQNRVAADNQVPVGIGTPGAWVATESVMKNCNSTVLNGQPLLLDLERALGKRVRMANDANCFALSEAIDGSAAGATTVFGVILGTGVGGGLVVDGKVLPGAYANAGEWGHTPLAYLRHSARGPAGSASSQPASHETSRKFEMARTQLGDRECYCGRMNCVETFLSGPGLELTVFELLGLRMTAEEVFAGSGPAPASALAMAQTLYCDLLAGSLAQVLNVFDPDVVVLGGGLSAQPMLYERLPEFLPRYLFNPEFCTRVLPPTHGDSSGVRGAAWLWPAIK